MHTISDRARNIVAELSDQIAEDMKRLADRMCHPTHSADDDDDAIKTLKTRIGELRDIRARVEHTMSGLPIEI